MDVVTLTTEEEGVGLICGAWAEESGLDRLRDRMLNAPGPFFANVKVVAETLPLAFPYSFDSAAAIDRFRDAALK